MKKLFLVAMMATFMIFGASSAFADMSFEADICLISICVYESDPMTDVPALGEVVLGQTVFTLPGTPCDIVATVFDDFGQEFEITGTAFGTQLNLALLKAWNENLRIRALIGFAFGEPNTFWVKKACFDENTVACTS